VQPQAQSVDVNSAGSLVATIYIAMIGAAVFIVQPGFVQGMVDYYGFSERQAGYTASAEVWGIAAASILLALGGHRCNWRTVLHYALLLFVCGNLLSILTSAHVAFSALRFIVGLGSGAMISLTFTIMGLTRHPDRNFGYLVAAVLVYAAIVLWVMPSVLHAAGLEAVVVFFALFGASGWFALRYMPRSSQEHPQPAEDAVDLARGYRILALLAMFVFFLAQGGIWAYLFLIGLGGGLAEQEVANGLMLSGVVGIAGAFVPVIVGGRFGRALPLAVSILGGAFLLSLLLGSFGALVYAVVVSLYGFSWNMSHPYLLASVASFDRGGQLVTHAVAAQMSGLAIGPAVSAFLLVDGNYTPVIWTGVSVFAFSYVLILVPLLAHRRQKNR
jgi:predicted MFS family arabinose efflux permease